MTRMEPRRVRGAVSLSLAMLIGILLTPLTGRPARAATPVSTCSANLNSPDTTYILTTDLVCVGAPAPAVRISATNVTFDLNGHTISGTASGVAGNCFVPASSGGNQDTIGIEVTATSAAHISGGTVRAFGRGIHLTHASVSQLIHFTATQNCFGVQLEVSSGNQIANASIMDNQGCGIQIGNVQTTIVNDSNDNFVNNNTVTGNASPQILCGGIDIVNSDSNVVQGNDFSRSGIFGVRLLGISGTDNTIKNNVVNDTATGGHPHTGIEAFMSLGGNVIKDNDCSRNAIGLMLIDGGGSIVQNNTCNDSVIDDYNPIPEQPGLAARQISGTGIYFYVGNGGVITQGNTVDRNGRYGILVDEGPGGGVTNFGNTFKVNTAFSNGVFDLADRNPGAPPACLNSWQKDKFVTDNEGDGPNAGCIQ